MLEESLLTYRQERRAFIAGLKHYYGVDFYKLEPRERAEWFRSYLESKRKFFEEMLNHWKNESAPERLLDKSDKKIEEES